MEYVPKEDFDQLLEEFEEFKQQVTKMMKNFVPKKLLTQQEAVKYTGTSPGTINEWVKHDGLKQFIRNENSNPKYDTKDLDVFIEKFKTKETKKYEGAD